MPRIALLPVLFCLPVMAQQPSLTPIRAEGARVAVTRGAGLQVANDAGGLIGGGADYEVHFASQVRFEPVLGQRCPTTQHLTLHPVAILRDGEIVLAPSDVPPTQEQRTAAYRHAPGIEERYDVRPKGMELSWRFASRPAGQGDLVVRYAIDTTLGAPVQGGQGLEFRGPHGGVRVGCVLGIAADGRRVDGGLHWRNDCLELSLPAAFVDSASYPIVLDPLIGSIIPVAFGITYSEFDADVAYSEYGYWLVVWRRYLSATSQAVRGQRIDDNGALLGSTVFFGSAGIAGSPRLTSRRDPSDDFGVVWTQTSGTTHSVQFQHLLAFPFTSTPIDQTTIASTTGAPFPSAVIGSDIDAAGGSNSGFVIVWEDDVTATIRRRTIWWSSFTLQISTPSVLWADGTFAGAIQHPAISRHAIYNDRLLVVARRQGGIASASAIVGQFVDTHNGVFGTLTTIATSTSNDLFAPSVDGYGNSWVIAWERQAPAFAYDSVRVVKTDFAFSLGTVVGYGGSALNQASAPTVCYAPTRTWLGYRRVTSLPTPTTTLQLAALRSDMCTSCNDAFSVSLPSGPRIVAARQPIYPVEVGLDPVEGLVVWDDSIDDIGGQRVTDAGTTGTVQALGTACGTVGNLVTITPPNIGQQYVEERLFVSGISTIMFFNFSPVTATVVCGSCEIVPLATVLEVPTHFFWKRMTFAVPCEPTLVGEQFLTQWLYYDLGVTSAPCPLVPGLYAAPRHLLTIGQ